MDTTWVVQLLPNDWRIEAVRRHGEGGCQFLWTHPQVPDLLFLETTPDYRNLPDTRELEEVPMSIRAEQWFHFQHLPDA